MKKESARLIAEAVRQEVRQAIIEQSEAIANQADSIEKLYESQESITIYINAGPKRGAELWHRRHDLIVKVRTLWQVSWKLRDAAQNL